MEFVTVQMEHVVTHVAMLGTSLLELLGVCVLVATAIHAFIIWIRKDRHSRLVLAEGIALALGFKMGGEVLRTVVVREWSELLIVGAIIVLRGLLTFLIHWEIRNEEKSLEKKGL
ncbi:MAG: DUF1622 domain-containing protein [Lachnospiraceae bacterium]|nr:DUF1622 domain-containing protein [Lachnospiraceae bacterium]